jgi:hypothetical protein
MIAKRFVIIVFAAVFATANAAGVAHASWSSKLKVPKSFKARFTWQEGSKPAEHGQLYFSHGRIRKEFDREAGADQTVEIIRPDEKKIFAIDLDQRSFYIPPWNSQAALLSEALGRSAKRQLAGAETIAGQLCDKYQVTVSHTGPHAADAGGYFWVAKDSGLPVQFLSGDSDPARQVRIQWQDLKPGNQAPILFEPPLYFKQVARPATTGATSAGVSSAAGGSTATSSSAASH